MTVVGIGLCGMALHMLLEGIGRKDIAMLSSVLCGAVLLAGSIQPLAQAVQNVMDTAVFSGLGDPSVQLMLRIAGMSVLIELASQLCKDAGTTALAQKIELAGKGMILCAALPTLTEFLEAALQLLS